MMLAAACSLAPVFTRAASAADQIYFPAVDNVTSIIVQKINAETVRIDMSAWYLTEHAIADALVKRVRAGVPVRLIGDRVAIFETDPNTRREFYWLASQGVPIRLRYSPTWFPEIIHWKATIFAGQNLVTFGSANYTPFELAPASATNYKDETVLFSDDVAIVRAFKTKFDQFWNDTMSQPGSRVGLPYFLNWDQACARESACADYRVHYPNPVPMAINTARLEPDYPSPPDMVWEQGPVFNARLIEEINRETSAVDLVLYRLTVDNITDALIAKFRSGVPVRVMIDPEQYSNRVWPEYWLTRSNVDKLWAAGIPIRQRVHVGLTHMKMLITARIATNASSNFAASWQRDHNYFVPAAAKPTIYWAMRNRFDAMWNDPSAFGPFSPLPPDAPTLVGPASGSVGNGISTALVWNRTPFAASYDVYLGTSPSMLTFIANVPARLVNDPPSTYSWVPTAAFSPGMTYYWRIVSRTLANQTTAGPVWSFTTAGSVVPRKRESVSPTADFDGDRRADLTVWRGGPGVWFLLGSASNYTGASYLSVQWGTRALNDVPLSGDYDGDGRLDIGVWRPGPGVWYILPSSGNYQHTAAIVYQWGSGAPEYDDQPVPADFDGDGRTDIAVWRRTTGVWYVIPSAGGARLTIQWGSGVAPYMDRPVLGDYDGDGRADIAVWRPSTGMWFVLLSSSGYSRSNAMGVQWGSGLDQYRDEPVAADYDGDGKTDMAVWRRREGTWYVRRSTIPVQSFAVHWGSDAHKDVPLPADYDADGRADLAVWRPQTGVWYVLPSGLGYNYSYAWSKQWGSAAPPYEDEPVVPGR